MQEKVDNIEEYGIMEVLEMVVSRCGQNGVQYCTILLGTCLKDKDQCSFQKSILFESKTSDIMK